MSAVLLLYLKYITHHDTSYTATQPHRWTLHESHARTAHSASEVLGARARPPLPTTTSYAPNPNPPRPTYPALTSSPIGSKTKSREVQVVRVHSPRAAHEQQPRHRNSRTRPNTGARADNTLLVTRPPQRGACQPECVRSAPLSTPCTASHVRATSYRIP